MLTTKRALRYCAALAFASVYAATPAWEPSCDETRDGRYQFAQLGGSKADPVTIELCREAACTSKSAFATVTDDVYAAPRPSGIARPYFLVARRGSRRIIAARRLVLEGAYNFRDLGGFATQDGKRTRWGRIFRSDALNALTPADYERLNSIGISLVCDLRTREERRTSPTDWAEASPMFLWAPVSENSAGKPLNGEFTSKLQSRDISVEEGRNAFEQFYTSLVLDSAAKFGTVLRSIASASGPAMFHCQGGRDRTGVTAALLLEILGVPRQTILDDYVHSAVYLDERAPTPETGRYNAEIIKLQPRYIEAIFRAVSSKYGSFDRYRRSALQVTDADVARLKARLLE
jgi:protein-tyrosine phosphatase